MSTTAIVAFTSKHWNKIKALGPFAVAQIDSLSKASARHHARHVEIELIKDYVATEIRTKAEVRAKLYDRWIGSTDAEERTRLEHEISRLEEDGRRLSVHAKALEYDQRKTSTNAPETSDEPSQKPDEISEHWIDRFNQLAKLRNEQWRAELLARALSAETDAPGSVSSRALWAIGTIEEQAFICFSKVLDMAVWPIANPRIPFIPLADYKQKVASENIDAEFGHIMFEISDVGVIGDELISFIISPSVQRFSIGGGDYIQVEFLEEVAVRGQKCVLLTNLGSALARFHEPKGSRESVPWLLKWLKSLGQKVKFDEAKVADLKTPPPGTLPLSPAPRQ